MIVAHYEPEAAWEEESDWLLYLVEQWHALRAIETLQLARATSIPHMTAESRAENQEALRVDAERAALVEEIAPGDEGLSEEDRFWKRQREGFFARFRAMARLGKKEAKALGVNRA